jgi:TusA-related sulfurtransferase
MEAGEVLELVADDPAAESDIQYLVKVTGQELLKMDKEGQVIRFLIKKVK